MADEAILGRNGEHILACPRGRRWECAFDIRRGAALASLHVDGMERARTSSFYVDDFADSAGIPGRAREFRKTGAAVVGGTTVLPVGAEVALTRTWRLAANHIRLAEDLKWPRGAVVKRHLGLEGLTLPGEWTSVRCVPPLQHWIEGADIFERDIPVFEGEPTMIGHWHRPPLALVFRAADGFELEIGTGDDLWRWEQSLGHGPESGSYKVFTSADGVELVREPLMCCEEFTPAPRQYRFTWHLAWTPAGEAVSEPDNAACWDAFAHDWPPAALREGPGPDQRADTAPCMASPVSQNACRRRIRHYAENECPRPLLVRGPAPAPCTVSTHVRRGRSDRPLAHWDLHAMLALSEWTRQRVGPDVRIATDWRGTLAFLPSVRGLFAPNGFEAPPSPQEAE